ncbi:MAG: hypothetical protein MHM6MM_002363 [Cercozoa sp. M6MM]
MPPRPVYVPRVTVTERPEPDEDNSSFRGGDSLSSQQESEGSSPADSTPADQSPLQDLDPFDVDKPMFAPPAPTLPSGGFAAHCFPTSTKSGVDVESVTSLGVGHARFEDMTRQQQRLRLRYLRLLEQMLEADIVDSERMSECVMQENSALRKLFQDRADPGVHETTSYAMSSLNEVLRRCAIVAELQVESLRKLSQVESSPLPHTPHASMSATKASLDLDVAPPPEDELDVDDVEEQAAKIAARALRRTVLKPIMRPATKQVNRAEEAGATPKTTLQTPSEEEAEPAVSAGLACELLSEPSMAACIFCWGDLKTLVQAARRASLRKARPLAFVLKINRMNRNSPRVLELDLETRELLVHKFLKDQPANATAANPWGRLVSSDTNFEDNAHLFKAEHTIAADAIRCLHKQEEMPVLEIAHMRFEKSRLKRDGQRLRKLMAHFATFAERDRFYELMSGYLIQDYFKLSECDWSPTAPDPLPPAERIQKMTVASGENYSPSAATPLASKAAQQAARRLLQHVEEPLAMQLHHVWTAARLADEWSPSSPGHFDMLLRMDGTLMSLDELGKRQRVAAEARRTVVKETLRALFNLGYTVSFTEPDAGEVVDVSPQEFDDELLLLLPILASNLHGWWARRKLAVKWKFALEYSAADKTDTQLCEWSALPPARRWFADAAVRVVLAGAVALGWRIKRRRMPAPCSTTVTPDDDTF